MNHHSILVRKISHLTDARYFAAMEVNWMSIQLNMMPSSFSFWHTMKDWIEGVKLAAEIPADDEMLLARTIIDAKPDGIVLNQLTFPEVSNNIQLFYEVDTIDSINLSADSLYILPFHIDLLASDKLFQLPPDRIYLEATWSLYQLNLLLDSGYKGGICLTGGDEDVTGVRDYGLMDGIIAVLGK